MGYRAKKLCAVTFVVLALMLCFTQLSKVQVQAQSQEISSSEKALIFLRDVVLLDVSKYNIISTDNNHYSLDPRHFFDEDVIYRFESENTEFGALILFKNSTLTQCALVVTYGLPVFKQSSANTLDEAKAFLQRYSNYSSASYIEVAKRMLNEVVDLSPKAITKDDITLSISNSSNSTTFNWKPQIIDPTENTRFPIDLTLVFCNGTFESITDRMYRLGSAEMKISKEQAISIAKSCVLNYSYTVGGGQESVSKFFDDKFIHTDSFFRSDPSRDGLLYPLWLVYINLGDFTPLGVDYFQVSLWADTGEVR